MDNVKLSRAVVNEEVINKYFNHLESSIKDIPATNIFNYNETNITDDPGAKLNITCQGRNWVERVCTILNHCLVYCLQDGLVDITCHLWWCIRLTIFIKDGVVVGP